ncbi:MAG: phenylalanine--tRNA ligase subunit alpha [Bacilli bacterium]|nr:phenylalanine--tRNA ligase subunit alpha [Bacilli bacterium]MDD4283167.1 phenylalanine--tRNA ligase subunit alpha [Bacilli bacterium]MDD4718511.1 phenylalanine--tRNA ligase subunit alpha [Bacilli bacterium]
MKENIENLKEKINLELKEVNDLNDYMRLKVEYLGKKGKVPELADFIKTLDKSERKDAGMLLNEFKKYINNILETTRERLEEEALNQKLQDEWIDITLPGTKLNVGSTHPLTKVVDEIEELFLSMGYDVVEGPEIESDLYNFEKLNLAKDHPARDMQDSFYITAEMLLRTQTSPVQARTMDANLEKGPIRMICPGKVYRKDDDDMSHSHQFTQIEGLLVDENISVAHLKGTLEILVKKMFGDDREIRFRPSFFPFTEPSLEVDVSCFKCGGEGCSICKQTGWIEILGSGMVHPNVLRECGYDPEIYSGFAFGMGPERIAMLKYGINDIRHFYTNNMNFLENFDRQELEDTNESK